MFARAGNGTRRTRRAGEPPPRRAPAASRPWWAGEPGAGPSAGAAMGRGETRGCVRARARKGCEGKLLPVPKGTFCTQLFAPVSSAAPFPSVRTPPFEDTIDFLTLD